MKGTLLKGLLILFGLSLAIGISSSAMAIDPVKLSDIPKQAEEMVNPVDYRDTPDTAKYVIRLSNGIYSRRMPQQMVCERFAELAAVYTNNRVKVKIYPASQLGDEIECVKAIQIGSHEMTLPATNNLAPFAPVVGFFVLPYLMASDGEVNAVQDETLDWINEKVVAQAKVRIMAWGVTPVPVAWAEVYNALQQRVIDGGDNPIIDIVGTKFDPLCPYVTSIHYMVLTHPLLISEKYFQSLPKDIQAALVRAGKEATQYTRWWGKLSEEKVWLAKAKDSGGKISTPIDEEKTWMARAKEIWPKYYKEVGGKEVVDRVLTIVERVRSGNKSLDR